MDSTILVVLVLSKDGDLVIFTELVVGPTKVLLVDRAMAADIDKRSAANVALSALEVFKKMVQSLFSVVEILYWNTVELYNQLQIQACF